jgi:hypothetical protein
MSLVLEREFAVIAFTITGVWDSFQLAFFQMILKKPMTVQWKDL